MILNFIYSFSDHAFLLTIGIVSLLSNRLIQMLLYFILEENMVICFEDRDTGRCMKGTPSEDKKYTTKMYFAIHLMLQYFLLCESSFLNVISFWLLITELNTPRMQALGVLTFESGKNMLVYISSLFMHYQLMNIGTLKDKAFPPFPPFWIEEHYYIVQTQGFLFNLIQQDQLNMNSLVGFISLVHPEILCNLYLEPDSKPQKIGLFIHYLLLVYFVPDVDFFSFYQSNINQFASIA